jgi:hypothetical protein
MNQKTETMNMNYQFPSQQPLEERTRNREPLVTEIELSRYVKICRRQLYNWRMAGLIPYIKLGKAVRFRLSDIERVLETMTIGKP